MPESSSINRILFAIVTVKKGAGCQVSGAGQKPARSTRLTRNKSERSRTSKLFFRVASHESGTGVSPVNHAQDARATFRGRGPRNEWKYQHRSALKKRKRRSIREKRRLASGQTQTLLQDPAIYDKLVGPIFRPELVVARLQPSEDDSLVALRADADRGQ